jgi:hypothetical protein
MFPEIFSVSAQFEGQSLKAHLSGLVAERLVEKECQENQARSCF